MNNQRPLPKDAAAHHQPWAPPTLQQVPITTTEANIGMFSDGEIADGS